MDKSHQTEWCYYLTRQANKQPTGVCSLIRSGGTWSSEIAECWPGTKGSLSENLLIKSEINTEVRVRYHFDWSCN